MTYVIEDTCLIWLCLILIDFSTTLWKNTYSVISLQINNIYISSIFSIVDYMWQLLLNWLWKFISISEAVEYGISFFDWLNHTIVLAINSLTPAICRWNLKLIIFQTRIMENQLPLCRVRSWNNGMRCMSFYDLNDRYLEHFLWNCPRVKVPRPHRWSVNIALGNGLVPLGDP